MIERSQLIFLCTLSLLIIVETQLVLPTTTVAPVNCAGVSVQWLAWSDWSVCSDSCGSCGVQIRTRTCLTTVMSCTCAGNSTVVQYCNANVCVYPRQTCCYNLQVATVNGQFACSGPALSSAQVL